MKFIIIICEVVEGCLGCRDFDLSNSTYSYGCLWKLLRNSLNLNAQGLADYWDWCSEQAAVVAVSKVAVCCAECS